MVRARTDSTVQKIRAERLKIKILDKKLLTQSKSVAIVSRYDRLEIVEPQKSKENVPKQPSQLLLKARGLLDLKRKMSSISSKESDEKVLTEFQKNLQKKAEMRLEQKVQHALMNEKSMHREIMNATKAAYQKEIEHFRKQQRELLISLNEQKRVTYKVSQLLNHEIEYLATARAGLYQIEQ